MQCDVTCRTGFTFPIHCHANFIFNQQVKIGQITINIQYGLIGKVNFNDETVISVFILTRLNAVHPAYGTTAGKQPHNRL